MSSGDDSDDGNISYFSSPHKCDGYVVRDVAKGSTGIDDSKEAAIKYVYVQCNQQNRSISADLDNCKKRKSNDKRDDTIAKLKRREAELLEEIKLKDYTIEGLKADLRQMSNKINKIIHLGKAAISRDEMISEKMESNVEIGVLPEGEVKSDVEDDYECNKVKYSYQLE